MIRTYLMEDMLESQPRILANSASILTALSVLSLCASYSPSSSNQGWQKEAEVLVMETMKQELGDMHPNSLASIGNLAWMYLKQSAGGRRLTCWEVLVIEMTKQELGKEHT